MKTIIKKQRNYIPQNLVINWENLAPIFDELKHRSINSTTELEQWLRNKSELEAALEEDFAFGFLSKAFEAVVFA